MSIIAAVGSRPLSLGRATPLPPYVNSVVVTPNPFTVDEGDTVQLTAQSRDQHGAPIADTHTWGTGDAGVATVVAGLVTGVSPGSVVITATSVTDSDIHGTSNGTVTAEVLVVTTVEVTPNPFTVEVAGTEQLTAQSYDQHGDPIADTHTWDTDDGAIGTVDEDGEVTGVSEGGLTVTATSVAEPTVSGTSDGEVGDVVEPWLPQIGDRILFDARAGGPQDMQTSATLAIAKAKFPDGLNDSTIPRFSTNFDGLGTHAFCHESNGFADTVLAENITASGSIQTIDVTWGSGAQPTPDDIANTKIVGIGFGTANVEAVTLTGATSTTLSGIFTENHTIGDAVAVCRDMSTGRFFTYFNPIVYDDAPRPRHFFTSFKHRMGKTAADLFGKGMDNTFALYNGHCVGNQDFSVTVGSGSNAGRKAETAPREIWDAGGLDRVGLLWGGDNGEPAAPFADTDSCSYGTVPINYGNYGSATGVDPEDWIAQVVTHVWEWLPENDLDSGTGAMRWYIPEISSDPILDITGIRMGTEAFDRIEIWGTFNSILLPQTEYTWDWLCWERPWVGTVPITQGGIPAFVSATTTTMTFNIVVPDSAPDTIRFWSGGTLGTSTSYTVQGSSQMGDDIALDPGDAGETVAVVLTGLTEDTEYTGITYSFGIDGVFNTPSGGLASETTESAGGAPVLTSATPNALDQGDIAQDIELVGTNFVSGDDAIFSNSDITVNSTTYNSPTSLTANIDVDPAATTGAGTVKVNNAIEGDSNTVPFTVNPGGVGVSVGYNFRTEEAYVTDIAPDVYVPFDSPQYSGQMADPRDRSDTVNAELAGIHLCTNNGTTCDFESDTLPVGVYSVRLALGDIESAQSHIYCDIYDGLLLRASFDVATSNNGEFVDATEVLRTSPTDWVDNNAPLTGVVCTSGALTFKFGGGTEGAVTVWAHVGIVQTA